MDNKTEKVALFRYGLIAPLVLETLPRGELTRQQRGAFYRAGKHSVWEYRHDYRHAGAAPQRRGNGARPCSPL